MKLVPPLPGEEALYGWINSTFEAAAQDPATKKALPTRRSSPRCSSGKTTAARPAMAGIRR
jgi:hypothetical protein